MLTVSRAVRPSGTSSIGRRALGIYMNADGLSWPLAKIYVWQKKKCRYRPCRGIGVHAEGWAIGISWSRGTIWWIVSEGYMLRARLSVDCQRGLLKCLPGKVVRWGLHLLYQCQVAQSIAWLICSYLRKATLGISLRWQNLGPRGLVVC
jgi:hypothetical protein